MPSKLRFIDLFAGLGGFHVALSDLGLQCVFASELNAELRAVYQENFGLSPAGDIRLVHADDIPKHDVLCAGFPCQPFSKAGEQEGLKCEDHGDLFWHVVRILRAHRPRYFVLENVPNLLAHDDSRTFRTMKKKLESLGYEVSEARFSPHQFGIPQVRDRLYIVGNQNGLKRFKWPTTIDATTSILDALEESPADAKPLNSSALECISAWQTFLSQYPAHLKYPGSFPVWAMEFGATYPFEHETPASLTSRQLARYRGAFGVPLSTLPARERMGAIPKYAREGNSFAPWKKQFIAANRNFYEKHRAWIDRWLPTIKHLPPSFQKFEWTAGDGERDVWKYILQFRASGLRVKRPTTSPSLIACTTSQVPIVGWQRRYMTLRECARLQSLDRLKTLPRSENAAFRALGNAVNARVVARIANGLFFPNRPYSEARESEKEAA